MPEPPEAAEPAMPEPAEGAEPAMPEPPEVAEPAEVEEPAKEEEATKEEEPAGGAKPSEATEAGEGKPDKKPDQVNKWLAWQRARLLEHKSKKKEEKKKARQDDLDFLEQELQKNQGFALVPSLTPSKEEIRAEALALARQEAEEALRAAKKARDDLYQRQLGAQTSLTRFFSPTPKKETETGLASGAGPAEGAGGLAGSLGLGAGVGGNVLAGFRGARGPASPACLDPRKQAQHEFQSERKALERRVNTLAAMEASARKAATEVAKTPKKPEEPSKPRKRLTSKTRESPWRSPKPVQSPEEAIVATALPNTLAVVRVKIGRPQGALPPPSGLQAKDRARQVVAARRQTLTGRRDGPTAEAKKALVSWTHEEGQKASGKVSPQEYWRHVSDSTGFTAVQVRQWLKPDHRRRLELWLEGQAALRQRRSCSRWLRFKSLDTGCRMGKDGEKKKTRPDLFDIFYPTLRQWSVEQRSAGWDISGEDLLDEYMDMAESELWRLEDLMLAGPLSDENKKWLAALRSRLESMKIKNSKYKIKARVKCMTGFTEGKPGLASPLQPAEVDCILGLTWQSWDYKLNLMFTGSAKEIEHEVIDSEAWVAERESVVLVFWDAVPVYLDPSVGTILVDIDDLLDLRKREEARRMKAKGLTSQQLPGCVRVRPKELSFLDTVKSTCCSCRARPGPLINRISNHNQCFLSQTLYFLTRYHEF